MRAQADEPASHLEQNRLDVDDLSFVHQWLANIAASNDAQLFSASEDLRLEIFDTRLEASVRRKQGECSDICRRSTALRFSDVCFHLPRLGTGLIFGAARAEGRRAALRLKGTAMKVVIDESGDEGTSGRGTRWLAFGSAFIPNSALNGIRDAIQEAAARVNRRRPFVHFSRLSHQNKRGVLGICCRCSWECALVPTDTTKILEGSHLRIPEFQFNYALRYAIERATQFAEFKDEPISELVIERRRNLSASGLSRYLKRIRRAGDPRIRWNFLEAGAIKIRSKKNEPLLSLADSLAHSIFRALEPDRQWGQIEPSYVLQLREKLWGGIGTQRAILGNGLVLMPTSEFRQFVEEYAWLREIAAEKVAPLR